MQNRGQKIEVLILSLAFILAVLFRFLKLGAIALGNSEASLALQALDLSKGNATIITGQPGYVALTSILFFIFGASDFWARFWPAIFGSIFVLVPLLFRTWIGKKASIILSLLFAVEPGLIALSRTPGGEMMTITCLLAAIGFYLNRKEMLAGISAGLALLSGVTFWPGMIILTLAWVVVRFGLKRTIQPDETPEENLKGPISNKSFILIALITAGFIGSAFFTHPSAISGLGSSIVEYFQSWAASTGISIKVMLIGLVGTESLTLPLAVWGIVGVSQKRNILALFLLIWFLIGALFILANPARQMMDWAWCLIPLTSLAALGMESLFDGFSRNELKLSVVQGIATIALIVFSSLNLVSMVNNPSTEGTMLRNQILSVLLPLVMVAVVTMIMSWGWSIKAAQQGLVFGIGLLLVAITFGTAWKSAGLGPRPESELWRLDALPVGERLLVKTTEDLSLWNTSQKDGIDVTLAALTNPALKWALRDFDKLKSEDSLGKTDTPSIIVSPVDYPLDSKGLYRGQVVKWSAQPDLSQMGVLQWAKWFIFRIQPQKTEEVLFWARNDLFKDSK